MRNPYSRLTDWWNREGERASAKGGFQLFWFSLTSGLLWSLFMISVMGFYDYFTGGKSVLEGMQRHFFMYFLMGMFVGLSVWKQQHCKSRRP